MKVTDPSPKIVDEVLDEGNAEAFIPYFDLGEELSNIPIHLRPEASYYQSRMGFFPNTLKLYMHVPWVAEFLFKLNNAIMRDERNSLNEHLKYRMSFAASRTNECEYCTAHHAKTLERRWDYSDEEIEKTLKSEETVDEREAVALEFVNQASLDSSSITDEMRAKLAEHFSPQEVMEIVLTIGFWKMYNTMHNVMDAPLEDPVAGMEKWVKVQPTQ